MYLFIDCPVCYNLVQEQINILRRKIIELRTIIRNINENPGAIDDTEFRRKLRTVNETVVQLLFDARRNSGKYLKTMGVEWTPLVNDFVGIYEN